MVFQSRSVRRFALFVCCASLSLGAAAQVAKRPIQHRDYDRWRAIVTPQLSPDGKFVVYGLFPQDGDGEIVVRNLQSSQEWRQAAGMRPEPPRADFSEIQILEGPPPQARGLTTLFTGDGRFAVVSTFGTKAEIAAAKKAKVKPEDMPKGGLVVFDLTTGQAQRVERVKSFQLAEKGADVVAYLKEAVRERPARGADTAAQKTPAEQAATAADPAAEELKKDKKPELGTELVLRDLASGAERSFGDVLEYKLTKDGAQLLYSVSSRAGETNGVYATNVAGDGARLALAQGKGKYAKLAMDEQQTEAAFLTDKDEAGARTPHMRLYRWQRGTSGGAVEIVSATTAGFRDACVPSDKGTISFSRDGQRIFFGCAPAAAEEKEADGGDDRPSVDLWSWKDDYIQPMQKVRATADKTRTYRAVYHVATKKLVQLADRTMPELTPSEDGTWALGGDDREYRHAIEYDTRYADSYLVDTRSGERKLLAKKHTGQVAWSPSGKYALFFNGKDWISVSVPDGKSATLTAKLGVAFWREDDDQPASSFPPYAQAMWTRDGGYVLLADEFDLWRVKPDGSEAVNLTRGAGRKAHLIFRGVNVQRDAREPDAKWLDPAQPLLLHAQSKDTRDEGFYRVRLDAAAEPQKLLFAPKAFSQPTKAKNADVLLLTEQRFDEFPDLHVTDSSFAKVQRITDANPQRAELLWGAAELVRYRNIDGVQLTAALYKPENFDATKKYPLIVYLYEKLSQNVNQFVDPRPMHSINKSYYVSNGYLVLEPDIVYTVGSPGQSALKCVLPAIQAMVDRGFVDEKAIGIQGHSWGGYQIAYMVTQTNRFRAAAAGAPVANMTSAYDGIRWGPGLPRQFQYERSQSRIGGSLWERPMRYIENSPVFMADRVNTPLLMLHNDADDAVPWYQGIEYFLALRRLGKEAYMFTYNGEPHGLRKRADQKDYTVRLQQWFDYYLKGAAKPVWMDKGIPYLEREQEKDRLWRAAGYDK
jgi:dipeptidyl aminopeptidase/acylaminoacyl peptidase